MGCGTYLTGKIIPKQSLVNFLNTPIKAVRREKVDRHRGQALVDTITIVEFKGKNFMLHDGDWRHVDDYIEFGEIQ